MEIICDCFSKPLFVLNIEVQDRIRDVETAKLQALTNALTKLSFLKAQVYINYFSDVYRFKVYVKTSKKLQKI